MKKRAKHPEELRDQFSKLLGMGDFSRAVRFIVLPNGDALSLMEENFGKTWAIFATESARKKITAVPVFHNRTEAEDAFIELANAVTERDRNRLEAEILELTDAANAAKHAEVVLTKAGQLVRLIAADEDAVDARDALDKSRLEDFSELSPDAQEVWLRDERERLRERVQSRLSADAQAELAPVPRYDAEANDF